MKQITVLIIASSEDPASINIKNSLLEQTSWDKTNIFLKNEVYHHKEMKNIVILTIPDSKITHENIVAEVKQNLGLEAKQAIFISRHTSKTGEPTLTVHPLGNYGLAEFGGKSNTLSFSSPKIMTQLLRILKKNAKEKKLYHKVCFEVTHHGPYMTIPAVFIEVGSTEEEWNKKLPAKIVAKTILNLLQNHHYEEDFEKEMPVLVGVGGGHYAPRFTDVALEKNIAFGHMIPSYQINAGNVNSNMIKQALDRTPNVEGVYIHRKALKKSQVTEFRQWFEENGIPVLSSKELPNLSF
ncbi:MAG: D-aminoacyl-tRNA deacylase [Thermoplasmatales archaeon]|nr:MAG: D-aminoacyl-tRNA deacylase [Thermoplasmatales archaeon]